jgi:beta-aspartyl-peptidase (threonine type)
MLEKPNKFRIALISGGVIGAVSGIPGISLINCCCCAGVWLGGVLAMYLYKQQFTEGMPPLEASDALMLGLMSGVVGAFAATLLSVAILVVLTDQVDAWNRGEVEGYMKGYWESDSTVFLSGGSMARGYQELLARYRKSYGTREKMGKLEFSELTIRLLSRRAAMATGIWRLYRATDEPWGRFTLIFEKKPEGWRITHDHTSLGD